MGFSIPTADDLPPARVMPAGGKPNDDEVYLTWRDDKLCSFADGLWLATWPEPICVDPMPAWLFDRLLHDRLNDTPLLALVDEALTYNHRLRTLGLALRDRRRHVERIADRIFTEAARNVLRNPH